MGQATLGGYAYDDVGGGGNSCIVLKKECTWFLVLYTHMASID